MDWDSHQTFRMRCDNQFTMVASTWLGDHQERPSTPLNRCVKTVEIWSVNKDIRIIIRKVCYIVTIVVGSEWKRHLGWLHHIYIWSNTTTWNAIARLRCRTMTKYFITKFKVMSYWWWTSSFDYQTDQYGIHRLQVTITTQINTGYINHMSPLRHI